MTPNNDPTERYDPERTLLIPRPGGKSAAPRPPAAPKPKPKPAGADLHRLAAGLNPLLDAANLLLALVPRLRATTEHADPPMLQRQLVVRVHEFEMRARTSGVARPKISAARYVLCCFLDEVIAATPWGAGGVWARNTLLHAFHEETWGGDKAFELLERLEQDVPAHTDVLELFFVCLALGFEGRWRGVPGGRAQLDATAARLYELLRPSGAPTDARTLSLRWEAALSAGHRRLAVLPLWVVPTISALLVLGGYFAVNARLEAQSRPLLQQWHAAVQALRAEDRPGPTAPARLAPLLQGELASGALAVQDEALRSRITLPADRLFVGDGAQLVPAQRALLQRVGQALAGLPGRIVVSGHADERTPASLQFPSRWQLTAARAQAVADALAPALGGSPGAERLHAEGRADTEPVAAGSDAATRAHNRRIEITLQLPRPEH